MSDLANTTEKTTTKNKAKTSKAKLGNPFALRIYEWQDEACDFIAQHHSDEHMISVSSLDIKRAIFSMGFKAFCEAKGYPSTQKAWKAHYKSVIKEAVAEINEK